MSTQLIPTATLRLDAIDWDFPASEKTEGIHNIHPYPAKFIPEIPRALIQELRPRANCAIFDPFCGSGTTLAEAQKLGYRSVGVDLNPIGCLISRVKTSELPPTFLPLAYDCVDSASRMKNVQVPAIPNLEHWFSLDARMGIARLLQSFRGCTNSAVLDHLKMTLSSMMVRVSNQESDTRYAAVLNDITEREIYSQFKASCRRLARIKSQMSPPNTRVKIIQSDVLNLAPADVGDQVGMVITSPPYPNAYEYWLYHKYRMWWLGYDPLEVKRSEIGARAHYFRKNPATVEDFGHQMQNVMSLCHRVSVSGAYACFLIGSSIIHGREIDNAAILTDAAVRNGFVLIANVQRGIASNRKSFNLAHARIKTENLLVFEKS